MAGVLVPTLVQTATPTNFASVASINQSITVTHAGDTLILTVWNAGVTSGYAATAVSGAGATWYRVGSVVNATASGAIDIWVGVNASAGAQTVAITMNGTHSCGCNLDEFQNLDNSVLINQANLFKSATGNSTQPSPGAVEGADPNTLIYMAAVTTIGTATITGNPAGAWTNETGPTSGGTQVAAAAYMISNIAGSFGINLSTPQWTTSGAAQWASLAVFLRAQQPTGDTVLNDTSVGVNAAVLETQATREYMDDVIAGLAESGTGVFNGCAVIGGTTAGSAAINSGIALFNWSPIAIGYLAANTGAIAGDATNPRRDLFYVTQDGTAHYLLGTPAANPCIPTPPQYPFAALAVVDVPANATIVDPPNTASPNPAHAQITDKRCLLSYPPSLPDVVTARAGAFSETFSRRFALVNGSVLTTAKLQLFPLALTMGMPIGHLAFVSATTASAIQSHWWFGLYDQNFNQLALTADQSATGWAANTEKSLAIATVAEGSAVSFTVRYTGLHYIGVMMVATTMPTLLTSGSGVITGTALAPVLGGLSDTGQSTPPAFPHVATTPVGNTAPAYAYVAA